VTELRARRCPRALAATWAWQAALGLLVAWPAASLVGRTFGGDPRADAALWDAGGHPLLVLLTRHAQAVRAQVALASIVLVFVAVAGSFPTGALMAAMLDATRARWRAASAYAFARAVRAFPALTTLLVLAVAAQGAVAGAAWIAVKVADLYVRGVLTERAADSIEVFVAIAFAPLVVALAVLHDLSRAAAVRFRVGAIRAAMLGVVTLRRVPWSTLWGWSWRQGASLATLLGASAAAGALGGRGGLALVALAIVHQATIAVRIAFRASWLARALRTVAPS
jgi:hypothetical protein